MPRQTSVIWGSGRVLAHLDLTSGLWRQMLDKYDGGWVEEWGAAWRKHGTSGFTASTWDKVQRRALIDKEIQDMQCLPCKVTHWLIWLSSCPWLAGRCCFTWQILFWHVSPTQEEKRHARNSLRTGEAWNSCLLLKLPFPTLFFSFY